MSRQHRRIPAEDMAYRRLAEGHSLTPGQLAAVERERAGQSLTDDSLLSRPGVMRALWPSVCRGCDHPIAVGDLVGLADTPTGRAWVCRGCLVASLAGSTTAVVPAPRDGQRAPEVAR